MSYTVDFINQTTQTWTMGVYQTLPSSPGLDSVSWKQTTAPRGGRSGVRWDIDYNVSIAEYQQVGGKGVYQATQTLPATLGTVWNVVFEDNVQQLSLTSEPAPQQDMIIIHNQSGRLANPGVGMSGEASVYKRGVYSGSGAQFIVTPTYWVALFRDLERGEVIASNIVIGPEQLRFGGGLQKATVRASVDGQTIKLEVTYS